MSSPIANKNPTAWEKQLIGLHQRSAHSNRISKLSEVLGQTITALYPNRTCEVRALDVGCGDMSLAESIHASVPETQWICTDIHELPKELQSSPKWSKYRQFDGRTLPFPEGSFDVVIFSDVLHHCMNDARSLLAEALRVGSYVIVKDHLEYGWISRQILRLMDFFGNYGYGVEIPKSYFTWKAFQEVCDSSSASIINENIGIDLYSGLPLLKHILHKEWQFVAVLAKSEISRVHE